MVTSWVVGGGALLGQGGERWLWEVTTRKRRQLHTLPSRAGQWRRGETKQEQQLKCDITSNSSASEVRLTQLIMARPLIHISLSPGTGSHGCPMRTSHPSSSSCVVSRESKGCATEQHMSIFCLFVFFCLWGGLGYCFALSAGAAWSL